MVPCLNGPMGADFVTFKTSYDIHTGRHMQGFRKCAVVAPRAIEHH